MNEEYDIDYVNLLNSRVEGEREYETLIIEHSAFTQTYYLNFDNAPLLINDNNGVEREFIPANISATNPANDNDLSQTSSFTIGDLFNVLDDELQRWAKNDNDEDVLLTHLKYTSKSQVPSQYITYDVKTVLQNDGAFTLNCGAPDLNRDETGESYTLDRASALRGAR